MIEWMIVYYDIWWLDGLKCYYDYSLWNSWMKAKLIVIYCDLRFGYYWSSNCNEIVRKGVGCDELVMNIELIMR